MKMKKDFQNISKSTGGVVQAQKSACFFFIFDLLNLNIDFH